MNVDPFADDLARLGWILWLPRPGGPTTGLIRCCSLHRMAPASGLPVSAASEDEIYLAEPCH
jgi:hypothetical protein